MCWFYISESFSRTVIIFAMVVSVKSVPVTERVWDVILLGFEPITHNCLYMLFCKNVSTKPINVLEWTFRQEFLQLEANLILHLLSSDWRRAMKPWLTHEYINEYIFIFIKDKHVRPFQPFLPVTDHHKPHVSLSHVIRSFTLETCGWFCTAGSFF